jgi:hypothetical protein
MKDKKQTYAEMLKDPRWVEKSKEIREWDGEVCQLCGNNSNLQVHHLCYDKNRMPWNYPRRALVTLCEKCHKEIHERDKNFHNDLKELIMKLGLNGVSKSTVLSILEKALKDSVQFKQSSIFNTIWCRPYTEPYWVYSREHKNNLYEQERLREKRFLALAKKAYEWNTGRKDFSEEKAFDGEYYDDIQEYKREFEID